MRPVDDFSFLRKTETKGEAMYGVHTTELETKQFTLNQLSDSLSHRSSLHSDTEHNALILNGCLDFLSSNTNNDSACYIFMTLQTLCKNIIENLDKIAELEALERSLLKKHEQASD